MSFEEARQFLRREDQQGNSLYEHLSRVILKLIVEKPPNADAMFEQLSQQMRTTPIPSTLSEGKIDLVAVDKNFQLGWCNAASKLYNPTISEATDTSYPDLMTESKVYEWAGVHLGRTETYRLYLAIKQKALLGEQNLRFWGKLIGRSGAYYVIQGNNSEPPTEDISKMEGIEGANKYAFWACSCVGGEWKRLPNVTPEAIIVSRKIKRFLTGDLSMSVPSYPPFPGGTEAHLLRAQIAQITSECSVSPSGFYAEDEEAEEGTKAIKRVEEIEEPKSLDELRDSSTWVHHEVPINVNGRCNVPPVNEDEAVSEIAQEIPDMPLLNMIGDDEILNGPAWDISVCPSGAGESPDSVVTVKSLKWPGAIAAAFGNKYMNIYCGFGYASSSGVAYEPPSVPSIEMEWMQIEEEIKGLVEEEDKVIQPIIDEGDEEEG